MPFCYKCGEHIRWNDLCEDCRLDDELHTDAEVFGHEATAEETTQALDDCKLSDKLPVVQDEVVVKTIRQKIFDQIPQRTFHRQDELLFVGQTKCKTIVVRLADGSLARSDVNQIRAYFEDRCGQHLSMVDVWRLVRQLPQLYLV